MKSQSVTIQIKATEQYYPVVPFSILYNVVLPFESVDEIVKCDHYLVLSSTFLCYCLSCCAMWFYLLSL